jgi:hypothetical protein
MSTKTKNGNGINRIAGITLNPEKPKGVTITPPNMAVATYLIEGTAPLCVNRFSAKAMEQMKIKQESGQQAKKGVKRAPKNFDACYQQARHISTEGWDGVAASAFRCGLIRTCSLVDFKMTLAKLSLFCIADGYDREDSSPLVKITKGKPSRIDALVRNETGVADIRPRPVWAPGWQMRVRIQFDADQFSITDVTNLMARLGVQVGIGEGRPGSKNSAGIGYGTFQIINEE